MNRFDQLGEWLGCNFESHEVRYKKFESHIQNYINPKRKVEMKLYLRTAEKNSYFIELPKEYTTTANLFHSMSLSFITLSEICDNGYKTVLVKTVN